MQPGQGFRTGALIFSLAAPTIFGKRRANFRETPSIGSWAGSVNRGKRKGERLRVSLLLGSACARWRRSPFGADGRDPIGTHHADHQQILPRGFITFITFITFGTPPQ